MSYQPGNIIGGKYCIVRLIGDGGMGAVYEARHEVLGSPVALKFLLPELARRPGLATRFLQEARVSARIQSPHVTRVSDVDTTQDGAPYLVMELLSGESLQQLLDRQGRLPQDQAIDYALQILSGLEAAHAVGVVHRDLKPDNVFICPATGGPVVKLLDFGIAKLRDETAYERADRKGLTRPGAVMGTPEYMAPEQLDAADRVDRRADIYSLGAMLYEMLSTERPANGADAPEIIAKVRGGQVRPLARVAPEVDPQLAEVVHRAIAPDQRARFDDALQMRLALAPLAGQLSHPGQLAATPAPVAVAPAQAAAPDPQQGGTANDMPAMGQPAASGVAPTLPPDEEQPRDPSGMQQPSQPPGGTTTPAAVAAGADKGGTQQVPAGMFQQGPVGARDAAAPPVPAAGGPEPMQPPAPAAGPGTAAGPEPVRPPIPQAATAPAGPRRRKRRSYLGAVAALLLGALVTGGVIAAIAMQRSHDASEQLPERLPGAAPATTITAEGPQQPRQVPTADEPAGSPEQPATPPGRVPSRPSHPSTQPGPRDAGTQQGTDAAADAGQGSPIPGLELPDGLPQIPTELPTALPSRLPPNFPRIPGLPGPRETGSDKDAGQNQ